MSSRFPIWRTRPARLTANGYWPILSGSLAVLVGGPLVGGLVGAVAKGMAATSGTTFSMLESVAFFLMISPMFSWIMLLAAIPLSIWAANKGLAGWGVAALCGAVTGLVVIFAINGRIELHRDVLGFAAIGVFMALAYWGAIRLIHPTAIGVDFKPPET